jgi:hypothetical protein
MTRRLLAIGLTAAALTVGSIAVALPASAAETCEEFVSDGAEILICAGLYAPSAGTVAAHGRTVELHEYLRRHVITVQLQRQNASGGWDVVDSADGYDVEGASAVTDPFPATATYRACATGGLDGHEQATVCSS